MACCCVGEDSTRSEALSFASSRYIYIYIYIYIYSPKNDFFNLKFCYYNQVCLFFLFFENFNSYIIQPKFKENCKDFYTWFQVVHCKKKSKFMEHLYLFSKTRPHQHHITHGTCKVCLRRWFSILPHITTPFYPFHTHTHTLPPSYLLVLIPKTIHSNPKN
jgi:hypothetical protein